MIDSPTPVGTPMISERCLCTGLSLVGVGVAVSLGYAVGVAVSLGYAVLVLVTSLLLNTGSDDDILLAQAA